MSERNKTVITICILLIVALLSYFVVGNVFEDPTHFSKSLGYLEEKQAQIFKLTGSTIFVSVALGLVPGDATTPLADKVTDIGSYFLIALCAVFLEKYLITLTGIAAFKYIIPAACIVFAIGTLLKNHSIRQFAVKLVLLGLIITMVVPTSIKVSQVIESTSQISIEDIENKKNEIVSENFANLPAEEIEEKIEEQKSSGISLSGFLQLISDGASKATETIKNIGTGITSSVSKAVSDAEDYLRILMIMLATMIVTSCLVPLAVLWVFAWIAKALLGIDLRPAPPALRLPHKNSDEE